MRLPSGGVIKRTHPRYNYSNSTAHSTEEHINTVRGLESYANIIVITDAVLLTTVSVATLCKYLTKWQITQTPPPLPYSGNAMPLALQSYRNIWPGCRVLCLTPSSTITTCMSSTTSVPQSWNHYRCGICIIVRLWLCHLCKYIPVVGKILM